MKRLPGDVPTATPRPERVPTPRGETPGVAGAEAPPSGRPGGVRPPAPHKRGVVALAIVMVLSAVFAWCLVNALQEPVPHGMPFGVTGSSPVVSAVQQKAGQDGASLDLITYSSGADLVAAAERGDIDGGYIPGQTSDTIVTVPAKSFFGEIYVRGAFEDAAKKLAQPTTTQIVAPLPTSDRTGAVIGLLMLPTLIGGYLIATMLFSFTQRAAVQGRIAIILGFSVLVALITGAAAGLTGAVPWGHLWALLPSFALVTASVALAGVALQHLAGKYGTLLIAILFIVIGGAAAGGVGVSLLSRAWQTVGVLFPPRHAVDLYRNVRYFDGHHIATPIAVLAAYALAGVAVILLAERRRSKRQPAAPSAAGEAEAVPATRRFVPKELIAPIGFALVLTAIFGFNYMSSGHQPVARNMPFGVVGSSTLPTDAQGSLFSLDVKEYDSEAAATEAMNNGEIYGALIAGGSPGSAAELTVVSSISDLSALDIAANFEAAATKSGEALTVKPPYAPTPLAPRDPFALVCSMLLVPLLVAGYMATTLLTQALGTAAGRWRGLWLLGFAVVTGLVVDLIATYWLKGLPAHSFWLVWPIMTLIILTVALLTAVLRRLLGPVGIFLTVIVVIQFGNPSSGGANGVPYLPGFWHAIGPFLPPRDAYLLLRNTVYFDGNGIGQPLAILLGYVVVCGALLFVLDWLVRIPEPSVPGIKDTDDAAVLAPVGPPP
jgi:hypothetical protein